jgi:predicted HD phosphohydrolase
MHDTLEERLIAAGFKHDLTHSGVFNKGCYQVNLNKPEHAERCLNEIMQPMRESATHCKTSSVTSSNCKLRTD